MIWCHSASADANPDARPLPETITVMPPLSFALTTAVALPVSANVTVSVPSSDGAKVEVLRSAAGLSGDVSGWTVEWNMPGRNWVGKLFVSGGSLWVEAHPRGTMISFR